MPIIARVASSRNDPPCSRVTCSRAAAHSDSESTSTPSRSNITAAIGISVLPSGSAGFRREGSAREPAALGGLGAEAVGALVQQFCGGASHGGERCERECAADGDALYAQRAQHGDGRR